MQSNHVVTITENTDSMMHVEGGVGWTLNRDIPIHSDGTFAYRSEKLRTENEKQRDWIIH